jgi:hypothetical protein
MIKEMLKHIVSFARDERGDSVTWIVLIIIGVVIAVSAYLKFKGSPGNIGNSIQNAGSNAATNLNSVRVQ